MLELFKKEHFDDKYAIHEYYMTIINSIPEIIYWVDTNTNLQGCNLSFIKLLGLNTINDLKGTPYEQMEHHALWEHGRVEQLKLDDMEVLFSGNAHINRNELPIQNKDGATLYFQTNRVPMYDKEKKIIGLIVILTKITPTINLENSLNPQALINSNIKEDLPLDHMPKVLMIEDNLIAQNIERCLLEVLNCEVDVASSGLTALELFKPGIYDLVLMDIGLEETSGYDVAKKLRNKEKNTEFHVPIIALTGYDADIIKTDCFNYSMEGAITKPLTSQKAEQIINHYVYHMNILVDGLKQP